MLDVRLWIRLQEARTAQAGVAAHARAVERARTRRARMFHVKQGGE